MLYDPVPAGRGRVKAIAVRFAGVTFLRPAPGRPWVAFDPARYGFEQAPLPVGDDVL